MSNQLTADSFLQLVERSGIVAPDRLTQWRRQSGAQGLRLDSAETLADALVEGRLLTRWQADRLLVGKYRGFKLGPYRILDLLGKGGMGSVYLAEHETLQRRCAIKVLPASASVTQSSALERFHREAKAVATLDNPNIVRAYDVNKETQGNSEIHYLVMEYVPGSTIHDLVQSAGVLDFTRAADYIRQAANGLAHAHACEIIHRDIKPSNLIVDTRGVVKVLDLGLARMFDETADASITSTRNERLLGTADYASPEQALDSGVDARSDIYSLGCVAYYMLAGSPPFDKGNVSERLMAHQLTPPPPLVERRPDVPADLAMIVERMLAKRPDARFQSAADVAAAMRRWLIEHGNEPGDRLIPG